MSVNYTDFDKIWASTSPLTPYEFSESQYKEGWNFVGNTPPSRQMWDKFMQQADEKMQYLANNYLPLSGGTMTGAITTSSTSSSDPSIKQNGTSGAVRIFGGTAWNNGSSLILAGNDASGGVGGQFILRTNDGTNYYDLIGTKSGALTWKGGNVITSALTGNILTASGNVATTGGTTHELCNITTHEAGAWLIVSYVDLSDSMPATAGSYQNVISTADHGDRVCRGYGHNGGGMVNVLITQLDENEVVTLKSAISAGTSLTIRGILKMVQIA